MIKNVTGVRLLVENGWKEKALSDFVKGIREDILYEYHCDVCNRLIDMQPTRDLIIQSYMRHAKNTSHIEGARIIWKVNDKERQLKDYEITDWILNMQGKRK
jgi:hypothetical protein